MTVRTEPRQATTEKKSRSRCALRRIERYELEMAFSRGLYTGWFGGINNQNWSMRASEKNAACYLGEVTRVQDERSSCNLQPRSSPAMASSSTPASRTKKRKAAGFMIKVQRLKLRSPRSEASELDVSAMATLISAASMPATNLEDERSGTGQAPAPKFCRRQAAFQRPIEMEVHGGVGKPLTLIARDEWAMSSSVIPRCRWRRRRSSRLTTEKLREQLGRLGGTPFKLGELKNFGGRSDAAGERVESACAAKLCTQLEDAARAAETVDIDPSAAECSMQASDGAGASSAPPNTQVRQR